MPRTTKQEQKAIYLPPELVERWRESAKKNHRSMNAEAIVALELYLDAQDTQQRKSQDADDTRI
ncbi:hypothetical protein KDH_06930 [Dictyobacter sp. S3.2.2.5]|uniref:Antitoxin FitA-like ribbon-helix-helix domain-containing protein n=1 Tax=Dictyobacter halimunensis TaxID=3026934 RepID=A0ABQ6FI85_9CHLR|nr:hypothetical protein KDH_06930 [Dictyobacter sp. S3.2.2.5]